jgi:transposase
MTTLYFEARDEDDLRKTGFSKDGKHQCPQGFLGLLVGLGGNPIGHELFKGIIFEGNTFIPVLQRMAKRFKLGKPIVIADSGLLSKKNISDLEEVGYEYILGARPKNETENIKQKILARNCAKSCNELTVLIRNCYLFSSIHFNNSVSKSPFSSSCGV